MGGTRSDSRRLDEQRQPCSTLTFISEAESGMAAEGGSQVGWVEGELEPGRSSNEYGSDDRAGVWLDCLMVTI